MPAFPPDRRIIHTSGGITGPMRRARSAPGSAASTRRGVRCYRPVSVRSAPLQWNQRTRESGQRCRPWRARRRIVTLASTLDPLACRSRPTAMTRDHPGRIGVVDWKSGHWSGSRPRSDNRERYPIERHDIGGTSGSVDTTSMPKAAVREPSGSMTADLPVTGG